MQIEQPHFQHQPPAKGKYDWPALAAVLQANPEQWTLAFTQERYSIATAIRNGSIAALNPANGFRITTRNNTRQRPRLCDIWLSYDPYYDKRVKRRG